VEYSYTLPDDYKKAAFKIRFHLAGCNKAGQYVNIDSIKITGAPIDTSVTFKINGQQVYINEDGEALAGPYPVTSTNSQVMENPFGGGYAGYSFSCSRDVSKLIKTFPVDPEEEHHTGNAQYTVGEVTADTGHDLSYAGWSLIIIYFSPETAGHYLYLWDPFTYHPGTGGSLDFDGDGQGGGVITGFVIPERIGMETIAARLTCFVGEGDDWRNGDYVRITGRLPGMYKDLYNEASPAYDVWNSLSPGMTYDGVDVDTFEVLWDDNVLTPGDTSLKVDMVSPEDAWNLVFMILSVRCETVTGGTSHYVLHGR
jgi:hypothetical protein